MSKSAGTAEEDAVLADPAPLFELSTLLAEGCYGCVYRAVERATGEAVALKVVTLEEDERPQELLVEARALRRAAGHPNVVQLRGAWLHEGEIFLAMELCDAGSVLDLYRALGPVAEPHVAWILAESVKALAFLHQQGVVHRDVKCGNILLTQAGQVKLADFGVSAVAAPGTDEALRRRSVIGTPYWMAPEVGAGLHRPYGPACDVWSLGIALIEMCTLNPPHAAVPPAAIMLHIMRSPAPRLPPDARYSPLLRAFVEECLIKDPDLRSTPSVLAFHPFLCTPPAACGALPDTLRRMRAAREKREAEAEAERGAGAGAADAEPDDPVPAPAAASAAMRAAAAAAGGAEEAKRASRAAERRASVRVPSQVAAEIEQERRREGERKELMKALKTLADAHAQAQHRLAAEQAAEPDALAREQQAAVRAREKAHAAERAALERQGAAEAEAARRAHEQEAARLAHTHADALKRRAKELAAARKGRGKEKEGGSRRGGTVAGPGAAAEAAGAAAWEDQSALQALGLAQVAEQRGLVRHHRLLELAAALEGLQRVQQLEAAQQAELLALERQAPQAEAALRRKHGQARQQLEQEQRFEELKQLIALQDRQLESRLAREARDHRQALKRRQAEAMAAAQQRGLKKAQAEEQWRAEQEKADAELAARQKREREAQVEALRVAQREMMLALKDSAAAAAAAPQVSAADDQLRAAQAEATRALLLEHLAAQRALLGSGLAAQAALLQEHEAQLVAMLAEQAAEARALLDQGQGREPALAERVDAALAERKRALAREVAERGVAEGAVRERLARKLEEQHDDLRARPAPPADQPLPRSLGPLLPRSAAPGLGSAATVVPAVVTSPRSGSPALSLSQLADARPLSPGRIPSPALPVGPPPDLPPPPPPPAPGAAAPEGSPAPADAPPAQAAAPATPPAPAPAPAPGTSPRASGKSSGWLQKKGEKVAVAGLRGAPGFGSAWKRRWMVLVGGPGRAELRYYKEEGAAKLMGAVDLASASAVLPAPASRAHAFEIVTKQRTWLLAADSQADMDAWIASLRAVLPP